MPDKETSSLLSVAADKPTWIWNGNDAGDHPEIGIIWEQKSILPSSWTYDY